MFDTPNIPDYKDIKRLARMSPSSVFVTGLNFEKIRQVMYALRDDIELSQVYYSTVYLVEEFYTLIATEMRSVKKDISYWEILAESSHWEIYLTQIHNKIYRRIVNRGDKSLFETFPLSMRGIKRLLDPPTMKVNKSKKFMNYLCWRRFKSISFISIETYFETYLFDALGHAGATRISR